MPDPADAPISELQAQQLALLGGHLCLDFVNTAEYRGTPENIEFLRSYEAFLGWCRHVEVVSDAERARLARAAARNRERARAVLAEVIALREALYRVFAAVAHDKRPTAAALEPVNAALARLGVQRRLAPSGDGRGAAWRWEAAPTQLDAPLGPLAVAAAELLTAPEIEKVRQCPGCGWLFLDTSRNGMRRWCSMAYCGSRMKSRRQYVRKRGTAPGA